MTMSDSEIKKALECCASEQIIYCEDQCPFYERCMKDEQLAKYVLELINRYEAEIEKLKTDFEYLDIECSRLEEANKTAKVETANEFADKLKADLLERGFYAVFVKNAIEKVKKEMAGED